MQTKIQNYINHIAFVLDKSGSMRNISAETIKVFDNQIKHLAIRSKELNQETRVSVYLFADTVECIIFDKDVLRLPSIAKFYQAGGSTALIDATLKSFEDLKTTSQLYGDHSFLIFCLTDGENNINDHKGGELANNIRFLPENWTVAVLVPNQYGVAEAKKFGFPAQNIQVWSTDSAGIQEVGNVLREVTDNYMKSRSTGVRGTKNLFNLDLSNIQTNVVVNNLDELSAGQYDLLPVHKESDIKSYVESWLSTYIKGSAYYQLTKPETIQGYKQICIQNKLNGKVYSGLNARKLLNLPDFEVKVNPLDHNQKFDIFVQSTSTNRKLVKGTKLIVLK